MTLTVPSLDICHAGSCACLTQPDLIRIASAVRSEVRTAPKFEQGNGRLHFPRVVHSSHPFPGDRRCGLSSTCRRRTSHGHRQHAQKNLVKIARAVPEISSSTDRQTDIVITILRNRFRGRSKDLATPTTQTLKCEVCLHHRNINIDKRYYITTSLSSLHLFQR